MGQLPAFMKPLHESSAGGGVADTQVRNLGNHCEHSYPAFITEVTYLFSCKVLKYNLMIFCFNLQIPPVTVKEIEMILVTDYHLSGLFFGLMEKD